MEPVEINAGTYYLRQMRADDLIDDRPALVRAHTDPELRKFIPTSADDLDAAGTLVTSAAEGWANDTAYTWAVAEPTTGEFVGMVTLNNLALKHRRGEVGCWVMPEHRGEGIAEQALGAVLRFGFGFVELHHIGYRHAPSNVASEHLARKLGFTLDGTLRESSWINGEVQDARYLSKLATE